MLDTTHHAHLFVGEIENTHARVTKLLREADFPVAGDPDFFYITTGDDTAFGIAHAHEVVMRASRQAFGTRGKVLFLSANTLTPDAQGALLKVSEEPTPGTHIILVVPHRESLLPTLLSRFRIYEGEEVVGEDIKAFLSGSYSARLALATSIAENDDARNKALSLVSVLLRTTIARNSKDKRSLSILTSTERFLQSPTLSVKTILEGLALILPRK